MKKILIILCETPFHSDKVEQSLKIAEAAIKKGNEVSVFLYMDGVYNMIKTQDASPFKMDSISHRIQELMEKGAKVFCCKLCKMLRGITDDIMIPNVLATGVGELNELIDTADTVISFTG